MLNKTQQLLAYLVKNHQKASITVLMKLSYLIDLVSIKRTGKAITHYKYIRYYYGPFDNTINGDIQKLMEEKVIEAKSKFVPSGEEYVVYNFNEECDLSLVLDAAELKIIDEVLENVNGYGARALTEIAYKTKPMLKIGATLGGNEHLYEVLDMKAS
jgi:uncharacterized phage-associated protein